MFFTVYFLTYLIEVHFSEFLLHFLFLLLLNVKFLLMLSNDLVDPITFALEFVVAIMSQSYLFIHVSPIVGIFAMRLLSDPLAGHRVLHVVVVCLCPNADLHVRRHVIFELLIILSIRLLLLHMVG